MSNKSWEPEAIKSLVNRWYEARQEAKTKAQFEQELREYIAKEKKNLVEHIQAQAIKYTPDGLEADGLDPFAVPYAKLAKLKESIR